MNWILLLSVSFIVNSYCYGLGRGDLEKYGPFHWILYSGAIKCDHDRTLDLDVSSTYVYFFDFSLNIFQMFPIKEAAKSILFYKNIHPEKRFIFFVGGYKSHVYKKTEEKIKETFKNIPNSYLLIFDHSEYTNNKDGYIKSYERSVRYVHYIGKAIANFLTELKTGGISPKNMHFIGHSLGGQISGHAGEIFHNNTGELIWRITGLDPAGPCFSNSLIQEQIRSGVAEYVEVYHCNAGGFGTSTVLADIDFFVNKKGQSQPNCKTPWFPDLLFSSKAAKCSHKACINIWVETVKNPDKYQARRCDSYKDFKNGACSSNEITTAGFWNPGNATGVFYFSTKD